MRQAGIPAKGISIEPSGSGKALVVDGAVQSVSLASPESLAGYWPAMLPDGRPRRALILGLGGGTLVQLMLRRFGAVPVVGVDDDPAVVGFGSIELGLDPASLEIVIDDAFSYVVRCRERFDYIAVDLYRGGALARGLFAAPFLRDLRRLLDARGRLVINLPIDEHLALRRERLTRFFRIERQQPLGKNCIVHARARGRT